MTLNFDEDMRIDESALDVEWLNQGELAKKYIKDLVRKKKEAGRAHEKVKTVRSEIIMKVNEDSEKIIGKSKPNAGDIEAYYRTREDYKVAKEEWLEAIEEAEFAELATKEICYTRRKALENLVLLHGQGYFAGPAIPRNLQEEREKLNKRANESVGSKLNKKKR